MKKSRIVWLIAALLVLATCLTSCGVSTISNVGKYLNTKYDLTPDMITETDSIDELDGYTLVPDVNSREFRLFTNVGEPNEETGKIVTTSKVFGLKAGDVIVDDIYSNNQDTWVEVKFLDPAFVVSKISVDAKALEEAVAEGELTAEVSAAVLALISDPSGLDSIMDNKLAKKYVTVSYTLYDINGKEVATSDEENDARLFGDLVLFNYKAYEINKETFELTEKMDVPEYLELNECSNYNDTYYYVNKYDDNHNFKSVTVYDRSFAVVSVWYAPVYTDDSAEVVTRTPYVLNNGDMLYQYGLVQDEDAKEYDYTYVEDGITLKIDLVTKLISAKNGEEKDLDVNYVLEYVMTNEELYDDTKTEEENYFNDKFDNVAFVYYIEDGRRIVNDATLDLVLLSNKGKIQKSLKLVDDQYASFADKVGDDLYQVNTLAGGMTLVNGKGKVVVSVNKAMQVVAGTYLVGERAIYDLELNKVYDLIEKDAEVEEIMDDVIFIRETTDDGYSIVALKADSTETSAVYSHKDEEDPTDIYFSEETTFGYYVIVAENGDLTYYNAAGDVIIKTTETLTFVAGSKEDGLMIMMSTDPETSKSNYYTFKVGEAEA